MKKILIILATAVLPLIAIAATTSTKEEYLHKYARIAVNEMRRTGIPASITLAQGLLESGAGESVLATEGNNHFGIKCHKNWTGKTMKHDDDTKGECFRVYPSAEASYRDHSDFLRYNDRYKFLFDYKCTDYKSWAYGLKKAGYATDPTYPDKLIKIIETYRLNRYDVGKIEVESPIVLERPRKVVAPNEPECVHFDVCRPVFEKNGVECVFAEEGETYAVIADAYDLFLKEILSFNDLTEQRELRPGDIVYIRAKKDRTVKGLDKYIVAQDGETLYDISQRFGVKLKSLCKLNSLEPDAALVHEQDILLR